MLVIAAIITSIFIEQLLRAHVKLCVHLYIVVIVFYMKVELILNGNKQDLMIITELFEGAVGDYSIARNTIKCCSV